MLKEFFEWLISRTDIRKEEVDGEIFSTQQLHKISKSKPAPLAIRNLTGLIDYLKTDYDKQPPVLIQVASPTEVNVFSTFNRDFARNHLIQAKALLPDIPFERFLGTEEFNILLQSCFVPNDDRALLLRVVGNLKEENVATFGDDGVSQQVAAKSGIAQVENIKVPNPVNLKPYRTFVEISQPESEFVFRMQNGPKAALFEADGGAWKLAAIHDIRNYLMEQLGEQIDAKQVTIIA